MKTVAKVLIYDSNGQLLILQRGKTHPNFPGHFDLPGGELEFNEQPLEAVVREVYEETGLAIGDKKVELVFEKINGTTKHLLYSTKISSNPITISLSWEHINHFWFSPENLLQTKIPANVDAYYQDMINYLAEAGTRI